MPLEVHIKLQSTESPIRVSEKRWQVKLFPIENLISIKSGKPTKNVSSETS